MLGSDINQKSFARTIVGHRWRKKHRLDRYRSSINCKKYQLDRWSLEENKNLERMVRFKKFFFFQTYDRYYRSKMKNC